MIDLYNGDCLEIMDKLIADGIKVDAIITDIPYGTTACSWDTIIPFDEMWERLNKLIKENGAICLFGSEPFSSQLRCSNIKGFRYDWIWEKNNSTGFQLANKRPLKKHEIISVFSKKKCSYYPQGLIKDEHINKRKSCGDNWSEMGKNEYMSEYTNYPVSILKFNKDENTKYHPTQKPIELMEYLVMTYTKENETVLDFTMGSGSTGVACCMCNRNFIGIELDKNYFNIAKKRIEDEQAQGKLF